MNEAAHAPRRGRGDRGPRPGARRSSASRSGPITLLDEVGIDVGEKVGKILHDAFGERMAPPAALHDVVAAGRLGRKNRKGFYTYGDDKKEKRVDVTVYDLLPGGRSRKAFAAGRDPRAGGPADGERGDPLPRRGHPPQRARRRRRRDLRARLPAVPRRPVPLRRQDRPEGSARAAWSGCARATASGSSRRRCSSSTRRRGSRSTHRSHRSRSSLTRLRGASRPGPRRMVNARLDRDNGSQVSARPLGPRGPRPSRSRRNAPRSPMVYRN